MLKNSYIPHSKDSWLNYDHTTGWKHNNCKYAVVSNSYHCDSKPEKPTDKLPKISLTVTLEAFFMPYVSWLFCSFRAESVIFIWWIITQHHPHKSCHEWKRNVEKKWRCRRGILFVMASCGHRWLVCVTVCIHLIRSVSAVTPSYLRGIWAVGAQDVQRSRCIYTGHCTTSVVGIWLQCVFVWRASLWSFPVLAPHLRGVSCVHACVCVHGYVGGRKQGLPTAFKSSTCMDSQASCVAR